MEKIRVVVADDHAVLRAGLKLLIHTQADMIVVGEAGTFLEALQKTRDENPDVLTLDMTMPGGQVRETLEQLRQQCPRTRVLVLTMHDDPAFVRVALAAGAFGYVVKKAADTELLTAIRAVAQGRSFIVFDPAGGQVPVPSPDAEGPLASLSPREREVLQLLAQGFTNQAIADQIFLSVKSVESYRARLLEKLHLRTRADLVRLAIDQGLLDPNQLDPRKRP